MIGDWNTVQSDRVVANLTTAGRLRLADDDAGVTETPTFARGGRRIDYALVSPGVRMVAGGTLGSFTDHRPVWYDVDELGRAESLVRPQVPNIPTKVKCEQSRYDEAWMRHARDLAAAKYALDMDKLWAVLSVIAEDAQRRGREGAQERPRLGTHAPTSGMFMRRHRVVHPFQSATTI